MKLYEAQGRFLEGFESRKLQGQQVFLARVIRLQSEALLVARRNVLNAEIDFLLKFRTGAAQISERGTGDISGNVLVGKAIIRREPVHDFDHTHDAHGQNEPGDGRTIRIGCPFPDSISEGFTQHRRVPGMAELVHAPKGRIPAEIPFRT